MEERPQTSAVRRVNSPAAFVVLIEKANNGFWGYVPDLPGCVAAGDSKAEVRELLGQAIGLHVEALIDQGESLPESNTTGELIEFG